MRRVLLPVGSLVAAVLVIGALVAANNPTRIITHIRTIRPAPTLQRVVVQHTDTRTVIRTTVVTAPPVTQTVLTPPQTITTVRTVGRAKPKR